MNLENKLNKNGTLNILKNVFGIIFPIVTVPYISRVLLTDNVGKVGFGNSIVSYFTLVASLGVSTYAIRECAIVKNNKEQLSLLASEIFSINLLSTIISYTALAIMLFVAKPLYNYRLLICIQSISILFLTLGTDWLYIAMEEFTYTTIRTIVFQLFSLILMFVFVKTPEDYYKYAAITVFASSGAYFLNILLRRKYCRIKFTFHMNLKKHFLSIIVLFAFMISSIICTNSDITILGLIRGDHEVGLYSTSVRIYNLVNTVVASITWVIVPQLSVAFSNKNYEDINSLLKYALNFIVILGLPCFAGIEIIAPQLIEMIAGKEYIEASLSLRILGIALILSFVGGWIGNLTMLPSAREKVYLFSTTISALVNISLNIFVIPVWGLNGAAVTTVISQGISLIILFVFMDKKIKISEKKKLFSAPILGSISIFIIGLVVQKLILNAYVVSVVTILSSIIIYLIILFVMKDVFFLNFMKPIIKRLLKKERLSQNE